MPEENRPEDSSIGTLEEVRKRWTEMMPEPFVRPQRLTAELLHYLESSLTGISLEAHDLENEPDRARFTSRLNAIRDHVRFCLKISQVLRETNQKLVS